MDNHTKSLYAQINAQQFLLEALFLHAAQDRDTGKSFFLSVRDIAKKQVNSHVRLPWHPEALSDVQEIRPQVDQLIDSFLQEVAILARVDL